MDAVRRSTVSPGAVDHRRGMDGHEWRAGQGRVSAVGRNGNGLTGPTHDGGLLDRVASHGLHDGRVGRRHAANSGLSSETLHLRHPGDDLSDRLAVDVVAGTHRRGGVRQSRIAQPRELPRHGKRLRTGACHRDSSGG